MSDEQNTYDNPYEQNQVSTESSQLQKDYGPDSDDEQKQSQQNQQQIYQQQEQNQPQQFTQHPTGFGAERQQLQEEFITIAPQAAQPIVSDQNQEIRQSGAHGIADMKVKEAADRVKGLMIQEITAFNYAAEATGASEQKGFEDVDQQQSIFQVTNPIKMNETSGIVKIGSVIKYTVTGQDSDGRFEIQRRYNEFLALNISLNERWPGCYVPAIPEKQLIGDKEDGFVEERRQLLERFIRECSKYEFIIESKEFKIFSRQAGEVNEVLEKMPKQTPSQILEKYRLNFPKIQEESASDMARYREKINIFNNFLMKCQVANTANRDAMISSVKEHQAHANHYKDLYNLLMTYEDSAVEYFSENRMEERVLTHPKAGDLKEEVGKKIQAFKNPFQEAALWIKGEMLDIQGMINAMRGREKVMKQQIETESKKRSDQEELEKMSLGKTTFKSFFKSKDGKEKEILNLQARIEQANIDIEEYRKLINFITVYQGHFAIEKFKNDKIHQYARMLYLMSVRSIANASLFATLSNQILELQQK